MSKVIAVSDVGHEILCNLAEQLVKVKPVGGNNVIALNMQPYNDTQLKKLQKCLQETLSITH